METERKTDNLATQTVGPRVTAATIAASLVIATSMSLPPAQAQSRTSQARVELGLSLFNETELNNPGSEFPASCSHCHFIGEDPAGGGKRFYADRMERSMMPGTASVARPMTFRNTPSLLDLELAERFYRDGRYASIEELLTEKLASRHVGWAPQDRQRAWDNVHNMLVAAMLVDYADLFRRAYRVDVEELSRDEAVEWVVRALTDHLSNIVSEQTSLWDAFADMNRIPPGPSRAETPKNYAGRVYGRLTNQEGRVLVKRPIGFSQLAYQGFKTFFRVEGDASVGNCVSCHVPPAFSDFSFHNTGIAQVDYELANGEDSFNDLDIPSSGTDRPVAELLADPRSGENHADLGHWNFVDLDGSPLRRNGESDAAFLDRMLGTFKTPTLRNLQQTDPYMHNGAYDDIEATVREIVRINQLARAGKMRAIDDDYRLMNLSEDDVPALTEFLYSFEDVDEIGFRELLIHIEDDE